MDENESKKILIFGDGGLSNGFIDNFLIDPSVSEIFYTTRKQGFDENRSGNLYISILMNLLIVKV